MTKEREQEKRKRRREPSSSEEESSEDETRTKRRPIKRNRLLNPLVYDQWTVRDHNDDAILYESPQNVGIAVYGSDGIDPATTLVAWKKPPPTAEDGAKATMRVLRDTAWEAPVPFAGRIEGAAGMLPPHLPEDVRASIAVLVRDVIHTCGVDPSHFAPQRTVREIVRGDTTHYVYTINYSEPTGSLILPLPLRIFSPLTPCKHAATMMLSKMHGGELIFTFCDSPGTAA